MFVVEVNSEDYQNCCRVAAVLCTTVVHNDIHTHTCLGSYYIYMFIRFRFYFLYIYNFVAIQHFMCFYLLV